MLILGIAPAQVEGLALGLIKPCSAQGLHGCIPQACQVPLDGITSLQQNQLLSLVSPAGVPSIRLSLSAVKTLNSTGLSMDFCGTWFPLGCWAIDRNSLHAASSLPHLTVHPSNPYLGNLVARDTWGDTGETIFKGLTEIQLSIWYRAPSYNWVHPKCTWKTWINFLKKQFLPLLKGIPPEKCSDSASLSCYLKHLSLCMFSCVFTSKQAAVVVVVILFPVGVLNTWLLTFI